jgi:hypothetical protein
MSIVSLYGLSDEGFLIFDAQIFDFGGLSWYLKICVLVDHNPE